MLKAAGRALAQLVDPSSWGVLLASVAGAGLTVVAIWSGTAALLDRIHMFRTGWLDWLTRALVGLGAAFVAAALFGAIAAVIASLLVDRVAGAVERRYYPHLPPPRRQGIGEQLRIGLSFLGAMILINGLALPIYLIWGANIPAFLLINGYLLGREYFELVALRRCDPATILQLRRIHAGKLLVAGILIAALSFLPLANLLTPIVATAFMLHILQALPGMQEGLPGRAVR
jgi:uncharacterized protein involved in cysteine biosynthesis